MQARQIETCVSSQCCDEGASGSANRKFTPCCNTYDRITMSFVSSVLRGDNQNDGPTIPHIFMINSLLHQQMNIFVCDFLLPQSRH